MIMMNIVTKLRQFGLVVKHAYMLVLRILHWFSTRLLLGIIFYMLFTPIACLRRWRGKDTLNLRTDEMTESYKSKVTEINDMRRPY